MAEDIINRVSGKKEMKTQEKNAEGGGTHGGCFQDLEIFVKSNILSEYFVWEQVNAPNGVREVHAARAGGTR